MTTARPSAVRRSRPPLTRQRHRLITNLDQVLGRMRRDGLTLHLQHQAGPLWSLSNGEAVPRDLAARIINAANVIPAGDSLFPDLLPGQSWRFGNE